MLIMLGVACSSGTDSALPHVLPEGGADVSASETSAGTGAAGAANPDASIADGSGALGVGGSVGSGGTGGGLNCNNSSSELCLCSPAIARTPDPAPNCNPATVNGYCCADEAFPSLGFCSCRRWTCVENDSECSCGTAAGGSSRSCRRTWATCCMKTIGTASHCYCDDLPTGCQADEVRVSNCAVDRVPCGAGEHAIATCDEIPEDGGTPEPDGSGGSTGSGGATGGGGLSGTAGEAGVAPCTGMTCGVDRGVSCGSCSASQFCDSDRNCKPACVGMVCGIDHGVSCGSCPTGRPCRVNRACCTELRRLGSYRLSQAPVEIAALGSMLYVSTAGFLVGVSMADPSSPAEVYRFDPSTPAATPRLTAMTIAGDRLYLSQVSSGSTSQISVFDVSTPATPTVLGSSGAFAGAMTAIEVVGERAYTLGGGALSVIDVSDPVAATLLGSHPTVSTTTSMERFSNVAVSGDVAYVSRTVVQGLAPTVDTTIIDVADPAAMTRVGSIRGTASVPLTEADVQVAGGRLYVSGIGFRVFDLTDTRSPALLGSAATDGTGFVVLGNRAYIAAGSVLAALDISNPASSFIVGTFQTTDTKASLAGANGLVFAADSSTSIEIFTEVQCD